MAQLSTDTLVYSQIIAKVQKFINDYMQEKNISPKDFDKAYDQYRKAVEIEPYDPEYRIDLANICLKIKKTPCIKLDRDISTLDLYKDIRDEALDQINMLSEQEKSAETDKQKQKIIDRLEKEITDWFE